MTSPGAVKPSRKTKDYQEVHSRGSSFGQNLNEAKVRELLSTEVRSPFAQFVIGIGERFGRFAADIAEAIRGEGGTLTEISGAVDERLGPLDNAITENTKHFQNLSTKADEIIAEQDRLAEEQDRKLKEANNRIKSAETATEELKQADAERRQKVAALATQAEQFTKKAQDNADALAAYKRLQQQKVADLTTTAEDALDRAAKIVDSQGRITGELKKARQDSKKAVDRLRNISGEWNNAITNAVSGLVSKTQLELAKAEAANAATRSVQDDLKNKNSALAKSVDSLVSGSQSVKSAADEARGAADALKNYTDIGGSLITLVPGTQTPVWTTTQPYVGTSSNSNPNVNGKMVVSNGAKKNMRVECPERWVAVSDKIRYKVSFWVKASAPSQLLLGVKSKKKSWGVVRSDAGYELRPTKNQSKDVDLFWKNGWVIGISNIPSRYRYCEYTIQFEPGTEFVSLTHVHWAFLDGGPAQNEAQQWIADLRIEPEIPDQATIDRLQTNAILKNEKVGSTNATAIQVMEKSWAAQKVVNQKQDEWNTAATEAREANTRAIAANTAATRLAFPDLDLTPRWSEGGRPLWSSGDDSEATYKGYVDLPGGFTVPFYRSPDDNTSETNLTNRAYFHVVPGVPLRVRWGIFVHDDADSTGFTMRFYGRKSGDKGNGSIAVDQSKLLRRTIGRGGKAKVEEFDSPLTDVKWLSSAAGVRGEWVFYEHVITLYDWVDEVRIQCNTNAGSMISIAGPHISSFAPLQEQTDKAQNKAIEALDREAKLSQDFRIEQEKWNVTSSKATAANTEAIRALTHIDSGMDVTGFMDLTADEVKDGLRKPWRPRWAKDMTYISPENKSNEEWLKTAPTGAAVFRNTSNSGQANDYGDDQTVAVDASLEYRYSVWVKSSSDGYFFITLADQDGSRRCVKSGTNAGGNPIRMHISKHSGSGWIKYEGTFRFKEGTTAARVSSITTNYQADNPQWVWFADLKIQPNVPTQQEVDSAQNRAISANTDAIRALARVDTGSSLVLYEDLTDDEVREAVKKGETPRVWKPSWATAADFHGGSPGDPTVTWYAEKGGWKYAKPHYAECIPGRVYKFSMRATTDLRTVRMSLTVRTPKGQSNTPLIPVEPVEVADDFITKTQWKEYKPTNFLLKTGTITPRRGNVAERYFRIAEGVTQISFRSINWDADGTMGNYVGIESLTFDLDMPEQAKVDEAQNRALEGLMASEYTFQMQQAQQRVLNKIVQNQLWANRDMIELVDIRSPKQLGGKLRSSGSTKISNSFVNIYYSAADSNKIKLECKGKWTGTVRITANTTSGLVDDWVCHVTDDVRTFVVEGGALVTFRQVAAEVAVSSLNRQVTVSPKTGIVEDPEGLVRCYCTQDDVIHYPEHGETKFSNVVWVRMKNGVTLPNVPQFTWVDETGAENTVKSGNVLPPIRVPLRSFSEQSLVFYEARDQDISYAVLPRTATGKTRKLS